MYALELDIGVDMDKRDRCPMKPRCCKLINVQLCSIYLYIDLTGVLDCLHRFVLQTNAVALP